MSGGGDESGQGQDPGETEEGTVDDERDPLTAVAEPAVIDLRDGVDTIAAHEAEQARRAAAARTRR